MYTYSTNWYILGFCLFVCFWLVFFCEFWTAVIWINPRVKSAYGQVIDWPFSFLIAILCKIYKQEVGNSCIFPDVYSNYTCKYIYLVFCTYCAVHFAKNLFTFVNNDVIHSLSWYWFGRTRNERSLSLTFQNYLEQK